jgi:hypothetical protein
MPSDKPATTRHFVLPWIAAFSVGMIGAGIGVNRLNLGWGGALLVMLLAVGLLVPLIRALERSAIADGRLSPAMRRYNRRMIAGAFLYTVTLFGAVYAYKNWHPEGLLLWGVGLLPSLGVLAMIAAMARLLAEEEDEYLRLKLTQAALFGTGVLLVVATVWGFMEQFGLLPHAPAWAAVPIFAVSLGLARCSKWIRA